MAMIPNPIRTVVTGTAMALMLAGGAITAFSLPIPARAETPVKPEKNPPGDIPDTQVFITYASDAGYALKVPEGWARSGTGTDVRFDDKLDAVSVMLSTAPAEPTVDWVKAQYVPELIAKGRAVEVTLIHAVTLPTGPAIEIAYSANSEPNPVTSKQVRLEANRYLFFRAGMLAVLDMSAPFGADNVDQWKLMSDSFRWR